MKFTKESKNTLKQEIIQSLKPEKEINKIVIFGSFLNLESKLFNPCLQNVQQCIEKSLKALLIENSIKLKKTHSISELRNILSNIVYSKIPTIKFPN